VRDVAKGVGRAGATLLALPFLASFAVRRRIVGPDRALEGSSQTLSLLPGLLGCYVRNAFLARVLDRCDRTATVEFGTLFSKVGTRIDANVYIGPRCHIGLVHLERDVLVGAGVHIPSGPATHGTDRLDRSIRDQPGTRVLVRIGEGAWLASSAVVMANVGPHAVVAAGAVVVDEVPEYTVVGGVPARVLRDRRAGKADA
jgi:virginiamycin A acetyltransferase